MRNSPISLRIPEPCAQPWAGMTPQGPGRHCAACQKVVIDFTQKTDAEILAVLRTAAAGQTCGRFGASQLGRPLRLAATPRSSWWQAAVAATVALLGVRTLAPGPVRAQQPEQHQPVINHLSAKPELAKPRKASLGEDFVDVPPAADSTIITGRVVDKAANYGIPGVTVLLKGTMRGISTDLEGYFSLQVSHEERNLHLVFQTVGYVSQQLRQPTGANAQNITVSLEPDVKGGLVWYPPIYTFQGVWQRLRSIPWRIRYAVRHNY